MASHCLFSLEVEGSTIISKSLAHVCFEELRNIAYFLDSVTRSLNHSIVDLFNEDMNVYN